MSATHNHCSQDNTQSGSALVYILIAIALLAALTFTFMEPSSQQTSSQGATRIQLEMENQASTIRSAIQECVLSYRKGDKSIDIGSSGSDPYARRNFPIKPNSTHYNGATIPATAGRLVRDIRCPGDPGNDDQNHAKIFGATSGKFMPSPPDLFEDWEYYNGRDGVFFWTKTDKSDAFISTALEKLDDKMSECEADVIDARTSSRDLDSDGDVSCDAGYRCFRVRMTINATAVYLGDTEGDEASCP